MIPADQNYMVFFFPSYTFNFSPSRQKFILHTQDLDLALRSEAGTNHNREILRE